MAGGFNVGTVYGDVKLETAGFKKSVNAINKGQKDMSDKSKKAGHSFAGMWKQMAAGMVVSTVISSIFRGITRQFSSVIEKGIEFGREWANVTTMLSISQKETKNLRKELINISPTLGDVTSLAKGMYQVLSASIEPAKAIEFLGVAAKAAKAGISEINVAVDALTTVINAYGMEAEEVTNVSDIMFATVKRGKLTFGELAGSLGTISPIAGTIGVKFEEVAAAIASLTRQGIPAATATMQLRQVFMSILKPSEQALATAKDLGMEWTVGALKAKGLGKFLRELKEKTEGNVDAMADLVPNVRALTGVLALAGRASAGFEKDLILMANASGMANEAFEKQMKTAGFWVDAYKAQIDLMKTVFFEAFVDNFKLGVENIEEFNFKLRAMTIQAEMAGKISGGFFKTLWGGIKTVVNATTAQGNYNKMMKLSAEETVRMEERQKVVNKVIGKVKGVFDKAKGGVKGFLDELSIYKLNLEKTDETTKKFTNKIKLLETGFKALKTPAEMLQKEIDDFKNSFAEFAITLPEVPKTMDDVMSGILQSAISGSKQMQDHIKEMEEEALRLGRKIKIDWEGVAGDMGRVWSEGFQGMMDKTGTFADVVSSMFDTVASGVSSGIGSMVGNLAKAAGGIFATIAPGIGAVATGIATAALGLFKKLLNIRSKAEKEAEEAAAAAAQAQLQFDAQVEEAKNVMSAYGEITDATAEKIAELRKTHEGYTAVSLAFNDVIKDVGISQENINALWSRAASIMDQMTAGEIDATKATVVLDDAFTQLKDAAVGFGTEGSVAMVHFILKTREAGIEVASVTEYVLGQLNKIPSALDTIIASQEQTGQSWEDVGNIAEHTFQVMLASGKSWSEVVAAMSGPLSALKTKYEEQGIEATEALKKMFKVVEVTEANKELFDAIEANRTIMEALGNSGWLTQDIFHDFATQAYDDFTKLQEKFGDDETALMAMSPVLQRLSDDAKTYGWTLDENTARIIQQAKDLGLVTEAQETEQAQQERLFGELGDRMAEIMQKLVDSIESGFARMWPEAFAGGESGAESTRRGIEREFDGMRFTIPFDYKEIGGAPNIPKGTTRGEFQGGVAFIPSGPTPITVHSRELVDITPLSELSSTGHSRAGLEMSGKGGGGNNYNVTINGPLFAPVGFSRADIEESAEIFFDVLEREAGRVG